MRAFLALGLRSLSSCSYSFSSFRGEKNFSSSSDSGAFVLRASDGGACLALADLLCSVQPRQVVRLSGAAPMHHWLGIVGVPADLVCWRFMGVDAMGESGSA